jgi:spore coat polysaccharide biosynthesis predicted glycosyltransferase SpsG
MATVARVEMQTLVEVQPVAPGAMVVEVPAVQYPELCLELASHQISAALHLSMAVAVMELMDLEVAHREIMQVNLMQSRYQIEAAADQVWPASTVEPLVVPVL